MTELSRLIEVLAWPLIAILVIWRFGPSIARLFDSALTRGFTLKVGGQELTMGEVTEQHRTLIADLQAQVVALREAVERAGVSLPSATAADEQAEPPAGRSVLWVDDEPKNNSYFVEQLRRQGVEVDIELGNAGALRRLGRRTYTAIVSDMGRREDGRFQPTAGLSLLEEVRQIAPNTPFILFTSARMAIQHAEDARTLGAAAITSSATDLTGLLKDHVLGPAVDTGTP
jgi:CheY-like chemotaxis protein